MKSSSRGAAMPRCLRPSTNRRCRASYSAFTTCGVIEVAADPDVVFATHVDGVLDLPDEIGGHGLPLRVDERHHVDANHAALVREGAQDVVRLAPAGGRTRLGNRCA